MYCSYSILRTISVVQRMTFKLCLMNLYLHNIGDIYGNVPVEQKDALLMDSGERYDYVHPLNMITFR